jgi:tRNA pseudouridine32 synthase / 23S rRNA pseudouridine746 synthase
VADGGPADGPRLPVIYQNERIVAVDKPGGMLTTPSRLGAADPRPTLGRLLEQQLGARLWPVHRLDLEVTGLVLFAKDADAHRLASAAFEERRVHKRYEALCEGAMEPPATVGGTFTWQSLLVRGKRRSFEAPHGKQAITHARLLGLVAAGPWLPPGAADEGAPLLHFLLEPETGRAHQLRVHLARAGCPVLGDALYGARRPFREPGTVALRSVALEIGDPGDRAGLGLAEGVTLAIPGFGAGSLPGSG